MFVPSPPYQKFATKRGRAAEDRAVTHCRSLGWVVVSRNWRRRGGEIDIVCWDQVQLIFVEVKARSTHVYGGARLQFSKVKLRRVYRLAERYCIAHDLQIPWRLDSIALQLKNGRWHLEHFEGIDTTYIAKGI